MSHFTKVQTKITDLDCLRQALDDLQYTCREGEVRVRGWRGQWSEADLVIDLGGPYNIGFRKAAQGNYEVISARVAEGSGEKLVQSAINMLTALKAESAQPRN